MNRRRPGARTASEEGKEATPKPQGEFLLYETEDGRTRVDCRFADESLWLTQAQMAELFQTSKQNVAKHLKAIFAEGELASDSLSREGDSVVNQWLTTAADGKRYRVAHYRLDAILAVGYRVRSARGTQFRRWATEQLRRFLIEGFLLDDERLKNPPVGTSAVPDRFGILLERIRDIRASERRMYLRVREIFAMAADYLPSLPDTTRFFRIIQNKLHYAVTGHTAAEIIQQRADSTQANMGLSNWQSGRVRKADVKVAKNYLQEPEIAELNRIVVMWLDFAEDQALRRKEIFLRDWSDKLDAFLGFNDRKVLTNAGTIAHDDAVQHAEREYEKFAEKRREALEDAGGDYATGLIGTQTDDAQNLAELGKVAKRLSKPGGSDAS